MVVCVYSVSIQIATLKRVMPSTISIEMHMYSLGLFVPNPWHAHKGYDSCVCVCVCVCVCLPVFLTGSWWYLHMRHM